MMPRVLRSILNMLAALVLFAGAARADDCIKTRSVPFDVFMHEGLSVHLPLAVLVPADYQHADIAEDELTYSYWMMPGSAERVKRGGDLPTGSGYMYGKVSLDVAYDRERDAFVDGNGREIRAELKGDGLTAEDQVRVRGHTVLFLEFEPGGGEKKVYAAYLSVNVDTNAVYISYRAPANDSAAGDCFWHAFKATLSAVAAPSKP